MNIKEDFIENQLDPMCLKTEVHVAITNLADVIIKILQSSRWKKDDPLKPKNPEYLMKSKYER